MPRWLMNALVEAGTPNGYRAVATTDAPCHLWLRWSRNKPQRHPRTKVVRGLRLMGDVYYCFTAYNDIEQEEAGDTTTHTFIMSDWPACETRWFYLWGTIGGEATPSESPIWGRHLYYSEHSFNTTITTPGNCANRHGGAWRAYPDAPAIIQTVGRWMRAAQKQGGGMRFEAITIPTYAQVTDAKLWLTSYDSNAFRIIRSRLAAELSPDAPTLAYITYPQFLTRRNTRVGIRNWDDIPAWEIDEVYQSPSIHTALTTVFNQPGWESGNAVLIFWDDFDQRTAWDARRYRWAHSYFYQPTKAPRLFITYNEWSLEGVNP